MTNKDPNFVKKNLWPEFREKSNANAHLNEGITPVQKFQLFFRACKGAALQTIGEKTTMTEAYYIRAWNRLQEVYKDDYMAILQLVRKLITLKPLAEATNHELRRMLDIIHDVEGRLPNYFKIEEWQPIIKFVCLFRLDATTYEKWNT